MKSAKKYGKPSLYIGLLLVPGCIISKMLVDGPVAGSILWVMLALIGYGVGAVILVKSRRDNV